VPYKTAPVPNPYKTYAKKMRTPKSGGPGNRIHDQRWIADAEAAGELEIIDPDGPDALPFGAAIRYNGDSDVDGSPYFNPPEGKRCKGHAYVRDAEGRYIIGPDGKRLLRPCLFWPVKGGTGVCIKHGGGSAVAMSAAKLRLLSATDAVIGTIIKIALDEKMDPKVRVAACNSILDRVGIRAGVDVSVSVKPWQDLLKRLDSAGSSPSSPTIEGDWEESA
jgi:hypothetical protein